MSKASLISRDSQFGNRRAMSALYFNAFFTVPKVELSFVPSPCTTVMIATEIPAAMSPYSIAVAPDSSAQKRLNKAIIVRRSVSGTSATEDLKENGSN
jgi:hypothetical protein